MPSQIPFKAGDLVKLPQNVILSNDKARWLRLSEPEYGVVLSIKREIWPRKYKIYIKESIWTANEEDIFSMED